MVAADKPSSSRSYNQWIATFAVFIFMLELGVMIAWTAPNIPRLTSEDGDFVMTSDEISWLVSFVGLGGIFGSVLGSVCLAYTGSRRTIFLTFTLTSVSWLCLIVGNSSIWVHAARLSSGVVAAMVLCSFGMYLGEIASPDIRGTLISVAAAGMPVGTVLGSAAESYMAMKLSSSIYLAGSSLGMIMFVWLKDTPYYLTKRADSEGTRASIRFYYGDRDVEKEAAEIKAFVEADAGETTMDKLRQLKSPVIGKSMFLIFVLYGLPHACGYGNVTAYMEVILKSGQSDLIDPHQFVIIASVTGIVSTVLTMKLIDLMGRRFLLMASGIGTSIASIGLGTHFYLLHANYDPKNLQYLPVIFLILFIITYSIGYTPVPSTVLSEIFPQNMKSIAACVATLSASAISFAMTKAYQPIVDSAGEEYAYWTHAFGSVLAVLCAIFLLPETKGKTFQQIQDMLQGKDKPASLA